MLNPATAPASTLDPKLAILVVLAMAFGVTLAITIGMRRRRELGTSIDRARLEALHEATRAAPFLREGLTQEGAQKAVRHLSSLLSTSAMAIVGPHALAWDGVGEQAHAPQARRHAAKAMELGRTMLLIPDDLRCDDQGCQLQHGVVVPLVCDDHVVGAVLAYGNAVTARLVRATEDLAAWVSVNLDLAELERSRSRAIEAELTALRAQISPHFIYNSLTAIASFVRTDPDQARELLLEFADFTRYALRRGGEFTTLADELENVERYLVLEKARFGDRLQVRWRVAPEVLGVAVPFLVVQPLVENAVQHGLEGRTGPGRVVVTADNDGNHAVIAVEDDGIGSDPDEVRRILFGESARDSLGMGNVDARLRQVFGDDAGLVVETAEGAGTKVSFRVPKFSTRAQV
ncbi:MAG: sensor histidine kinase [Actinomycetales bacterium]